MSSLTQFNPKRHQELVDAAKRDPSPTVKELADEFETTVTSIRTWLKRPVGYIPSPGRRAKLASEMLPCPNC